jgi:isopentenyl-diphosphate delta-isomerase
MEEIKLLRAIGDVIPMSAQKSQNADDIEARKGDHIRLCLDEDSQADYSVFQKYRLPYVALPEVSLDEVDTTYELCGKTLSMPLIIASMTGGSEHGRTINTNLAKAAEICGVAMGVGSQRIGLEKQDAKDTFKLVRTYAPNACIIANMGAVQLNYGHGVESYRAIVDMVQADAVYLHLNPLQEALQPGGDTDFRNILRGIELLVRSLPVPVFVKEVGHGISGDIARKLFEVGVHAVDIAGIGGTSYAWVEAARSHNASFATWFKDIGIPTDRAVIEATASKTNDTQLVIASGGVRSPIDGLKAHALGADLFSAAVPFLRPAMDSAEAITDTVLNWQRGLSVAMFTAGISSWVDARKLSLSNDR